MFFHTDILSFSSCSLKGLRPLKPQMWMSLTSKKISWSQSRTKKLTVPVRDGIQPESHKAYCKRTKVDEKLTSRLAKTV